MNWSRFSNPTHEPVDPELAQEIEYERADRLRDDDVDREIESKSCKTHPVCKGCYYSTAPHRTYSWCYMFRTASHLDQGQCWQYKKHPR
jgi:hypothetical protein